MPSVAKESDGKAILEAAVELGSSGRACGFQRSLPIVWYVQLASRKPECARRSPGADS